MVPDPQGEVSRDQVPPTSKPLRILLVEDHFDIAYMTKLFLDQLGHEVTLAASVAAAIAANEADVFDVLLSDFSLLDGTGCDVLVAVKGRIPRTIAMTAHGDWALLKCEKEGFDLCIQKPVDLDYLSSVLAGAPPPRP